MSRAGSGYLSGNALVPFPFEDWQDGLVDIVQGCFVDAGVHLSAHAVPDGGWPSIGRFMSDATSIRFSVRVGGAEAQATVSASSDEFPSVSGTCGWGAYVVTLSSERIRAFCAAGDVVDWSLFEPFSGLSLDADATAHEVCRAVMRMLPLLRTVAAASTSGLPAFSGFTALDVDEDSTARDVARTVGGIVGILAETADILSESSTFHEFTEMAIDEGSTGHDVLDAVRRTIEILKSLPDSPPARGFSSPSWLDGDLFLRLCPRCVTVAPAGLTSIRVYDGVNARDEGPHFVLSGDVSVRPGNNMTFEAPADGANGFSLSAVPGAGLGVVPCPCTAAESGSSPLFSRDGHVRLFNDACYDIEPAETTTRTVDGEQRRSRTLRLHAKCTACCTCDMYAGLVDRLADLADEIRAARSAIDDGLSKYEDAVRLFNQRLASPKESDVVLSLTGVPVGSNLSPQLGKTGVRGRMGRCAFTAIVRNASFADLAVTVSRLSGTDTVVEASASWSDANGNPLSKSGDGASAVVGQTFTVCRGRSLVIAYVSVKDELVGSVSTGGYTGEIEVGVSGGGRSIGTFSKTVSV